MNPGLSVSASGVRSGGRLPKSRRAARREKRERRKLAEGKPWLVHAAYLISPEVEWTPLASVVKFRRPSPDFDPVGGLRGEITEFSSAAKRNFMQTMQRMRRDVVPIEVGLTYPRPFPECPSKWKRDLDRLSVRMERELPGMGLLYVLEPQGDGAPHFHLPVYGLEKYGARPHKSQPGIMEPSPAAMVMFRKWLSRAWYEVVGSGDEKHLRAGTHANWIESREGAVSYFAGYLTKHSAVWEGKKVGRYWGKRNAKNLPLCEMEAAEMTPEEKTILERHLRGYITAKGKASQRAARARGARGGKPWWKRTKSYTVFCDVGQVIARLPEMVDAKLGWKREQKAPWHVEGRRVGAERSGEGMRQHPGPRGLSACTVQPARRLSASQPQSSTLLSTPEKGVGSIGASDASGGLLEDATRWRGRELWREAGLISPEGRSGMLGLLVRRAEQKSEMRAGWARDDCWDVKRRWLDASGNPIEHDAAVVGLANDHGKA